MSHADLWKAYQSAKRAWMQTHPSATPEQLEAECRRIAERLGL